MPTIDIRNLYGKIIHSVFVDQPRQLFPCDLRGLSLVNVDLTDADLPGSNLEGCILIGANLSGADLQRANLRNADLRYSNLKDADLRDADLSGESVVLKAKWRVLRYHREIALHRERLERDLRFLRRQSVDTSFADKFLVKETL